MEFLTLFVRHPVTPDEEKFPFHAARGLNKVRFQPLEQIYPYKARYEVQELSPFLDRRLSVGMVL